VVYALNAKLLLAFASKDIFGSELHGTHDPCTWGVFVYFYTHSTYGLLLRKFTYKRYFCEEEKMAAEIS
jgi:hypothetical protein